MGVAFDRQPDSSMNGSGCLVGYVISSDCMDCGVCEYMCPEGAIFEAKRQFVIRKDLCNGCGDCVPYCPARAIVPRDQFKERQERSVRQVLGAALAEDGA
jgi:MinD superfamily P-loop ATPase